MHVHYIMFQLNECSLYLDGSGEQFVNNTPFYSSLHNDSYLFLFWAFIKILSSAVKILLWTKIFLVNLIRKWWPLFLRFRKTTFVHAMHDSCCLESIRLNYYFGITILNRTHPYLYIKCTKLLNYFLWATIWMEVDCVCAQFHYRIQTANR